MLRRMARLGISMALAAWTAHTALAAATPIAELKAVSGPVQVLQEGRWVLGFEGLQLNRKDQIKTGSDAIARIQFKDADLESGATATLVDLVPNTHISLEQFAVTRNFPRKRTGFLELVKGAVRSITKGWSNGSIFSVKAGTTVCGIRGSAAAISFDPATGAASFTSLSGEMFTFPAPNLGEAIRQAFQYSAALALGSTLPTDVTAVANNGNLSPGQKVTVGAGSSTVIVLPKVLTDQLNAALEDQDASIAKLEEANRIQAEIDSFTGDAGAKKDLETQRDDAEEEAGSLSEEANKILKGIVAEVLGDVRLNQPASDQ